MAYVHASEAAGLRLDGVAPTRSATVRAPKRSFELSRRVGFDGIDVRTFDVQCREECISAVQQQLCVCHYQILVAQ